MDKALRILDNAHSRRSIPVQLTHADITGLVNSILRHEHGCTRAGLDSSAEPDLDGLDAAEQTANEVVPMYRAMIDYPVRDGLGNVTVVDQRDNPVARTSLAVGESVFTALTRLRLQPVRRRDEPDGVAVVVRVQPIWLDAVVVGAVTLAVNPVTRRVSMFVGQELAELEPEDARDLADAVNEKADITDDLPTPRFLAVVKGERHTPGEGNASPGS